MSTLNIPALRGVIGDWIYYVTLLPFKEIAERIKKTEEIHSSRLLRDMIQRSLSERSKDIAEYLKTHKQRFFNALVIGVYDGKPEWQEISIKKSVIYDPLDLQPLVSNSIGVLRLSGDEKLFAIDGQHRVEGIKEFIKKFSPEELKNLEDEICTIFVAHDTSTHGLQRTRRLFTTLNRYAKPVSLTDIIALDEDNIIAIVCRDLLENHPLFKGKKRVSLSKTKAISPDDNVSITSLVALYQSMDIYFCSLPKKKWEQFKSTRPSDKEVNDYIEKASIFWNRLISNLPDLQKVVNLKDGEPLPDSFRGSHGGNLLFRPIALPMIIRCLKKVEKSGISEEEFIRRFSDIPRKLDSEPWYGVLWDGNMIVRDKNQKLAENLILWMINFDPDEKVVTQNGLKQELARILNKPPQDVKLPNKITITKNDY